MECCVRNILESIERVDFSKGAPASKPCRNQWTLKCSEYPLGLHTQETGANSTCQLPNPGTCEGLAFPETILPVSIFNQQSNILRCAGLSVHHVLTCFDWHSTARGTCVLFIPVLLMLTAPVAKGRCHPGFFSTLGSGGDRGCVDTLFLMSLFFRELQCPLAT